MIRLPKWYLVVLALALVAVLATPVLAADTKGRIKSVSADKNEFVMTDENGKDWTFELADDAKISLNDQASKLNQLKAGDDVGVIYTKKGDKLIATEVRAKKK
jgi:hypothetical protein